MIISFKLVFIISQVICMFAAEETTVFIGGIFDQKRDNVANSFRNAIDMVNVFNEALKLRGTVLLVDTNDSFAVQKAACNLISQNVAAIFGPNSSKSSGVVTSICKRLQIPHFIANWQPIDADHFNGTDSYTRNLFPNLNSYSIALYEIIKSFRWQTFAAIYDNNDSLLKLKHSFSMTINSNDMIKPKITFYKVPKDPNDYKLLLKSISKTGINQVLIDCSLDITLSLLRQSSKVNMMNEYVNYLLIGTDAHTLDLSKITDLSANITTMRMINSSEFEMIRTVTLRTAKKLYPMPKINQMTTETALVQDAVAVFAKAFGDDSNFINDFRIVPTTCEDYKISGFEPSSSGKVILEKIDANNVPGITGNIHFDENGTRNEFYIDVLELKQADGMPGFQSFITYDTNNEIQLLFDSTDLSDETQLSIKSKIFRVIIHDEKPFVQLKGVFYNTQSITENDKYEGFAIDLIEEIAKICGFKYNITINKVTGKENAVTREWDGIVGEIVNKRADLAIGDITITHARKRAIDFSSPIMSLGISILYGKPIQEPHRFFKFMDPLSIQVWLYVATSFLYISIAEFLIAKITDTDWENPHPCDENPEELENIWNMHNCIWLTVGSIMQQGCDILPKGVPTRLAASSWWFFALIVISSYTANLAAFLTKEHMEDSIKNVEDLANQKQIEYGLVRSGSTRMFFEQSNFSTYQKIWQHIKDAEPTVLLENNQEGIDRVKNSNRNFAFFMESVPLQYITHRECNLTAIGNLLDSKEYGIGMPMNSPYRTEISRAILILKENFIIHNLTEKWWKTRNVGADGKQVDCTASKKEESDTPELDMDALGGIFFVLAIGLALAIFLGMLEFIWSIRRVSIEEHITPCEAFQKEFLFAVEVWRMRKPVKPPSRKSSINSSIYSNEKVNGNQHISMETRNLNENEI